MQRRKESKAKKHQRIRNRVVTRAIPPLPPEPDDPPIPPRSTLDADEFAEYLEHYFGVFQAREEVYGRRIFRRLRFSSFVLKQRSEAKFVKTFRKAYGPPETTTIIYGDWSQPSQRYQAPSKTVGFRKMFKRAGYQVFLIDEYKTSSVCPACNLPDLETFLSRPSPRPWRHGALTTVYGLLRCQGEHDQQDHDIEHEPLLWNRDVSLLFDIRR